MTDIDLESKLLAKMTDVAELSRIYELGLRPDVFETPINAQVFSWIVEYWLESGMATAPTQPVLEYEFPGVRFTPVEDVEELTEWLVDTLKRRLIVNKAQDLMRKAITDLPGAPEETISGLWQGMYSLVETTASRTGRHDMGTRESIEERRRDYQRSQENPQGMTMGLPELDEHTQGLHPGELGAVAAYTKTGKSFLLCKATIAAHMGGAKPILFTLEMSVKEMRQRLDAINSGVSYSRLQSGQLLPVELERLHAAQEELLSRGSLPIERPPRGDRTVKGMLARARQLGCHYVLIDQLSFVDAERAYLGDRALTQKHGELIFDLKDEISRDAAGALPCMLAVQLNRETVRESANGGRGGLKNFANSSMIEQTVDIALGLWRNQDMRNNNAMGLDIMGSRRSDPKSWLLQWRLGDRTDITVRQELDEQGQ